MKRQRPPAATLRANAVQVTRVSSAGFKLEILKDEKPLAFFDFQDVAIGDSMVLHGLNITMPVTIA